jgi:hypothetical protein
MSWSARDDSRIRAWLHDGVPERAPGSILESTFARTALTRPAPVRPARAWFGLLLAAALALAAVAAGAAIVALSRPPSPTPAPALASPRFLGDFLWQGGYRFETAIPTDVDISAAAAAAIAAGMPWRDELGAADQPMFGRLICEQPGLCGPDLWPDVTTDAGTVDRWSVWVVEYPQEAGYVVVRARDGQIHSSWDGDRLSSCPLADLGHVPWCPAGGPDELGLPTTVRYALAVWGQIFVQDSTFSTRPDRPSHAPPESVDPRAIADELVTDPSTVDAFGGSLACRRASCPDGVATEPGEERAIWLVSVDDGARWAIADAETGEILRTDRSPVEP